MVRCSTSMAIIVPPTADEPIPLTPLGVQLGPRAVGEPVAGGAPDRHREAPIAEVATGPAELPWWKRQYGHPVKPEVVLAFSRQVASFLEAGISLLEALEVVREEIGDETMSQVISEMSDEIERGSSFSDAVGAHPKVFPGYYRAMVRSAEFTGNIDEVLDQLGTYLERDIMAKRQVKSALTYPIIILIAAVAAMVVMSVFVLPKFSAMYRSLGARLPLPTLALLKFTDFMHSMWIEVLLGTAVVVLLVVAVFGGARGKSRRDRLAMHTPVIGPLFHLISLERFCRVLAALTKAGVPLPEGIAMAAESTNNTLFTSKLGAVREALIRGGGLSSSLFETGIFPTAARQMIRVGERTGTLSNQLRRAAVFYEREVTFQMKRATDLFQPAVIVLVALIVGFVAVAQVAAMYSIFNQIG